MAEGNGQAVPAGAVQLPVEEARVGWLRLPDGTMRAMLTFVDPWGQRTHLLDADSAETVGAELRRLAKFLAAGLEPPSNGQVSRR